VLRRRAGGQAPTSRLSTQPDWLDEGSLGYGTYSILLEEFADRGKTGNASQLRQSWDFPKNPIQN
jgi:hypothetical protein